jgi:hypothetical protein
MTIPQNFNYQNSGMVPFESSAADHSSISNLESFCGVGGRDAGGEAAGEEEAGEEFVEELGV